MERSKYLTTGEMAKLTHVTKNTLFHYDKIGLFLPEIVLDNGYRYYSVHQIDVLNAIVMLRELGMSLEEIGVFLKSRSPENLLALYEKEEIQIEAQIERLKNQKQWIQDKSRKVKNVLETERNQIVIRHQPELYYTVNHLDSLSDMAYAEKITELTEAYQKRNDGIYYEIGNIQWKEDILKQVYGNYQNVVLVMKRRPKGMKYETMPKGEYLVTYFKGHWKDIGAAYQRMIEYAAQKELKLSERFLEMYAVDGLMAEKEADYVTEISVGIENQLSEK